MKSELRFIVAAGTSVVVSIATIVAFAMTTSVVLADAPGAPVRSASIVVPAAQPVALPATSGADAVATDEPEEAAPEPPGVSGGAEPTTPDTHHRRHDNIVGHVLDEAEQVFPEIDELLREMSAAPEDTVFGRGRESDPNDDGRGSWAEEGWVQRDR